jgi:hypothetical protein
MKIYCIFCDNFYIFENESHFLCVDRYPQLYESLAARDYIRWCKELAEFLEQHPEKLKQKTPKQTKRKSTVSGWMLFSNEMRAKVLNHLHFKIP